MTITLSAFKNSPDEGQGQARDLRVRWALGEIGEPYDVRLLTFDELKRPEHLARSPFGAIPTYEEGDVVLFESGAILLHLAQSRPGLLPEHPSPRARAIAWMFAALNTVEPPIVEREVAGLTEADRPWFPERLALVDERIRDRLRYLAAALADQDWLVGAFTAADILMVTTLRRLEDTTLLDEHPTLAAYTVRAKSRPAYRRAYDAQYQVFVANR